MLRSSLVLVLAAPHALASWCSSFSPYAGSEMPTLGLDQCLDQTTVDGWNVRACLPSHWQLIGRRCCSVRPHLSSLCLVRAGGPCHGQLLQRESDPAEVAHQPRVRRHSNAAQDCHVAQLVNGRHAHRGPHGHPRARGAGGEHLARLHVRWAARHPYGRRLRQPDGPKRELPHRQPAGAGPTVRSHACGGVGQHGTGSDGRCRAHGGSRDNWIQLRGRSLCAQEPGRVGHHLRGDRASVVRLTQCPSPPTAPPTALHCALQVGELRGRDQPLYGPDDRQQVVRLVLDRRRRHGELLVRRGPVVPAGGGRTRRGAHAQGIYMQRGVVLLVELRGRQGVMHPGRPGDL